MTTPSRAFRPGQRVRVSFEATVVESASDFDDLVRTDNPLVGKGVYAHALHPSQVEVIDDPASDPIGTVRRWDIRPLIKTADPEYPWVDISRASAYGATPVHFPGANGNEVMRGTEIIGMTPGFGDTT